MTQNLEIELRHWIGTQLGSHDYHFVSIQGDASFRTYYRVTHGQQSFIAMLAPPLKERTDAFVAIAKAWKQYGIAVPNILAWHQQQGFVLLSDFGDTLLLDVLSHETVDTFYICAMQSICALQNATTPDFIIPAFNEDYVRLELALFKDWFITTLLNLELTEELTALYEQTTKQLVENFTCQEQVVVHRDFHSRNLMVLTNGTLGIIDFQDAMIGPITYDVVSLLKDCYITWPTQEQHRWLGFFFELLSKENKLKGVSFQQFLQWFDWVGLQRHLKVLGIFSRLNFRDNKPHYLQHLNRIMKYVLEVTSHYGEFADFNHYLQTHVTPIMQERIEKYSNVGTQKVA